MKANSSNRTAGLRIGVLGHYGNDNLGDEAIIQAVIENLRRRVPGAEIVCFSVNPANTAWRHGVKAYPLSRGDDKRSAHRQTVPSGPEVSSRLVTPSARPSKGLKSWLKAVPGIRPTVLFLRAALALPAKLFRELRFIRQSRDNLLGVDLLVIAGSNQFLDNFGGVWDFPYSMLKWAWLGRLSGSKVAFLSVGAGPLTLPVSRLFVRLAMLAAHEVSFRDEASRALAVSTWAGQDARVTPDLAFSLKMEQSAARGGDSTDKPCVGINPMPVHDARYWHAANERAYARYVNELAVFCGLVDASGYPWYLYSTQPKDINVMYDVIEQLKRTGLQAEKLANRLVTPGTVDELVHRLAQTDILVATRFHGVVLPLATGRPALGICYHRKTGDVLDKIGLNGFHMNIDELDARIMADKLQRMDQGYGEFQLLVRKKSELYRAELDEQYERLLDLVPQAREHRIDQSKRSGIVDVSA